MFLFVLAMGMSPFEDENEEIVRENILNVRMTIAASNGNTSGVSRFGKFPVISAPLLLVFLARIFVTDVKARPSAEECLSDAWIISVRGIFTPVQMSDTNIECSARIQRTGNGRLSTGLCGASPKSYAKLLSPSRDLKAR